MTSRSSCGEKDNVSGKLHCMLRHGIPKVQKHLSSRALRFYAVTVSDDQPRSIHEYHFQAFRLLRGICAEARHFAI